MSRPYDSTATARTRRAASACAISVSPWWKPEQMTTRSGSAYTPRTRAR